MRILGLDVSTKTGFAVMDDGILTSKGLLTAHSDPTDDRIEDFSILDRARRSVDLIRDIITAYSPDMIFIEQTNAGKFRSSQKQLEFIHCLLLSAISTLNSKKDFVRNTKYVDTSKWRSTLKIKLSAEQRQHNKKVKAKIMRGKITSKHLAVAWVNQNYNLSLKIKDNDIADAICVASFGFLHRDTPSIKLDLDKVLLNN
jgi:Holliday junction resolvasome RuvABC endonuclease subunit